MHSHLLAFNIGFIASILLSASLGIVSLYRGWKKPVNIVYFLNNVFFCIFAFAYVMGVNESNALLSTKYIYFTLVNLFTVCLTAHLAVITFDKWKEHGKYVLGAYTAASVLLVFFLSDMSRYVITSEPLLYFPNFYNLGDYYWLFAVFFFSVAGYFFYFLTHLYQTTSDAQTKIRIKYFALSFGWGYGIGSLGFLTLFGAPFDPVYASALGLYVIPLGYAALKYNLIELGVIAKNATIYAISTALVGLLIIAVNVSNNFFVNSYPGYPFWLMPLVSGIIVVAVCFYIWRHIREVDILKYEFINNVSHKFRTPLTHIRWLAEELRTESDPAKRNADVEQMQHASMRLFELTNIVIDIARDDNDSYQYQFNETKLEDIITDMKSGHEEQISHKHQNVILDIEPGLPAIRADKTRMQFAIQILFENALIYTPVSGTITISIKKVDNNVVVTFKDTGIGIAQEEIPHLFAKFYRTANARHADTEGMGIGLFMTKNIIEKHGGKISVESEGEGKGSTFSFSLPVKSR